VLGCVGLAGVFGWYGWRHHPVRHMQATASRRPGLPAFTEELERRIRLARVVLPDLLGGLGVLGLLSLGTGVYARRLEVWLEAHRAGEAAALRGVGLDQVALGANRDRRKGALL